MIYVFFKYYESQKTGAIDKFPQNQIIDSPFFPINPCKNAKTLLV